MRAVFFTYVWPEPWSSAAGVRTKALMQALLDDGWKLHALSPCSTNRARTELESIGINCREVQANDSSVQELLKSIPPDLVIFDRFVLEEQFAYHVRLAAPHAARVIDTQDLHFLRHSREIALKNKIPLADIFAANIAWDEKALLRECASIFRSDLSLVLSDFEEKILKQDLSIPAELVELASFSFHKSNQRNFDFSQRKNFIFLGNYRHPPNHDAAIWLARELWPQIRKRVPNAELHLYGSYPPKEIMQLDDAKKGVRALGPIANAQETLSQYRLNLAPLRFGAGVKGKIADAWAASTPTLTTPIGSEGMGTDWQNWCARDDQEFIRLAVENYSDESRCKQAVSIGNFILNTKFDPQKNAHNFLNSISQLISDLENRRTRNLFGKILWREEARSSEYFSKWIEAKNKDVSRHP